MVYYAAVHSHMSHITCWGESFGYRGVLRAQKTILRMIFNHRYHERGTALSELKKVLTLLSIFKLKCVCYVKKHLSVFEVQRGNHNYNPRYTALKIPK
nr:unnamed protein product [Callosobruchus analis]